MVDLKQYIPEDDSWIENYFAVMGETELISYYNNIFVYLLNMPPRTHFNILQEVKPENYELFIKCVYTCIRELTTYGFNFSIENDVTLVCKW